MGKRVSDIARNRKIDSSGLKMVVDKVRNNRIRFSASSLKQLSLGEGKR